MTMPIASEWNYDVQHASEWLLVRVHGPPHGDADGAALAEHIWQLMQQHQANRVVVDLSDFKILRSVVVGQLVQLHKRVFTSGGIMRLAGLSDDKYSVLVACRLQDRFRQYGTAAEAMRG
jgi:anti-anti-sigma factor